MKPRLIHLLPCLLILITGCKAPYRGPSIGVSLGYNEFEMSLTLFSSPAPAAATLDIPAKAPAVLAQK